MWMLLSRFEVDHPAMEISRLDALQLAEKALIEDGFLLDDGVVRVPAHHKDDMVAKMARIHNLDPSEIVSVGDNHTDLSMQIPGSGFIGFNGQKQIAIDGFAAAGVPHVQEKDCRLLWPHLFEGEPFPAVGGE